MYKVQAYVIIKLWIIHIKMNYSGRFIIELRSFKAFACHTRAVNLRGMH